MSEDQQKALEERHRAEDRYILHLHGGQLHVLTGIALALITTHPDLASLEKYFNDWDFAEIGCLEEFEARRLEGLDENHPDKKAADDFDSDFDHFLDGRDDVLVEIRNAFEKVRASIKSLKDSRMKKGSHTRPRK